MAFDLTLQLEDRPGALADLGETMGNAGINIEGIVGSSMEGKDVVHILVQDPEGARQTLEMAGIEVLGEREVMTLQVEDHPGLLGVICRHIHVAGVNIELVYLATNNRLVLGVDDIEKLQAAL